jgi:hypothetical protein
MEDEHTPDRFTSGSHNLGSYRSAHEQDRLQTCLGGLVRRSLPFPVRHRLNRKKALSSILWFTGLPVVRVQPDHDMRGLASPTNVSIPCYFVQFG